MGICNEPGCTTPQEFKEGGQCGKCVKHGGFPRCVKCLLNSVNKVGTLCKEYCDPKTVKRRKVEEERIEKLLVHHDTKFQREVRISFSGVDGKCQTCAKIDFIVTLNGIDFLLEIDEHQHSDREVVCEVTRMIDVMRVKGEGRY